MKKNADLIIILIICLSFISLYFLNKKFFSQYDPSFVSDESKTQVKITCLKGNCWHRSQGSLILIQLLPFEKKVISLNDEVMTVGEGSSLLIEFLDSQVIIANTALVKVRPGLSKLISISETESRSRRPPNTESLSDNNVENPQDEPNILDEPEEGPQNNQKNFDQKIAAPYISMGNFSIELISPKDGIQILSKKLPVNVLFSFRSPTQKKEEIESLKKWKLIKMTPQNTAENELNIELKSRPLKEKTSYFTQIKVTQYGSYALMPQSFNSNQIELAFKFEVLNSQKLQDTIEDLLNKEGNSKLEFEN